MRECAKGCSYKFHFLVPHRLQVCRKLAISSNTLLLLYSHYLIQQFRVHKSVVEEDSGTGQRIAKQLKFTEFVLQFGFGELRNLDIVLVSLFGCQFLRKVKPKL